MDNTAPTYSDDIDSPDARSAYLNQKPQYTEAESMLATFKASTGALTSIGELGNMDLAHQHDKDYSHGNLSVEDLNKKYPNLTTPFKEPTGPFTAGEIARRQYDAADQQQKIDGGPQGTLYGVGRFGAGLFAHIGDPVELGAMLLTDGLSSGIQGLAVGSKVAAGAMTAKAIAGEAARGAAVGTVGQLITEPLNWAANSQANIENSAKDTLYNAAMGGLVFGGIHAALGLKTRFKEGLTPVQELKIEAANAGSVASGKVPNLEPILHQIEVERSGVIDPASGSVENYQHMEFDPAKPDKFPFYVAKDGVRDDFKNGKTFKVGDTNTSDNTKSISATSNQWKANGYAGSPDLETPGTIHEIKLDPKTNLEPLDQKPSPIFKDALNETIKDQKIEGIELKDGGDFDKTSKQVLKDVFDKINSGNKPYAEVTDKFNKFLDRLEFESKIRDIDGYHSEVDPAEGVDGAKPSHTVELFDGNKATQTDVGPANTDAIPKPQPEDVAAAKEYQQSPQSNIDHNEVAQNTFDSHSIETPELKTPDIQSLAEEKFKELKQTEDPSIQKSLDNYDKVKADESNFQKVLKTAADCLGRG